MEDRKHNNAEWCVQQIEEMLPKWKNIVDNLDSRHESDMAAGMLEVINAIEEILYR